jgi:regulator of sigma E protease
MDLMTTFLLGAQHIIYLIIALFGIGFLIGFHELGHFIFCKFFGIRTPQFSIGFGPQLFSRKIGDTEFSISAIPLGGFVEIAGAAEVGQGEQKHALSKESDSFAMKPYYQKFLVMMGGISFNLLFAYVTCILLVFMGMPKTPLLYPTNARTTIAQIEPESIAEKAGFQVGDSIRSIDAIPLHKKPMELIKTIQGLPNKKVLIQFKRNGKLQEKIVTIGSRTIGTDTVGSLGIIALDMKEMQRQPFFTAIGRGIQMANAWIVQTVYGFMSIFQQRSVKGMGGPVALISMLSQGAASNFKIFLLLLVIISTNLAILNLIPLPILDGGQLLFYTIEAIVRRPLPIKVREYIHIASWLLILALILYLSIKDIGRIASPHIEGIKQFLGFGR